MSIYQYKAVDKAGKIIKGKISAQSESELESKLRQAGLDLLSSKATKMGSLVSLMPKVDLKELVLICIHFYHLERAGVPILESVGDLRDHSESEVVKEIMMDVYDSLRSGQTFSKALSKHGMLFDKIFIGLVSAGERTGSFAEVFHHLEKHYRWLMDLKKKIKKATMYPLFVLLIMIGVLSMMMMFVIPKISAFLLIQQIELPFYTIALIAVSNFFAGYWPWMLGVPITAYISIKVAAKFFYDVAYMVDGWKLKIPLIGSILRKLEVARFCHFFALTYRSGVPILECLEISGQVTQNAVIKDAIYDIKNDVAQGKRLTDAVIDTGQFPPMVTRMFKVGEDSGNLDQALENINIFYDAEINTSIENMVGVIQPTLTIVMGGLMLWITIAVFGPIYAHFGDIGKIKQ